MNPLAVYRHRPLCDGVTVISTASDTMFMYLIQGKDRCVLIDTGYGHGDLGAYVRGLTDLPVDVINTHGHPDHVGANDAFGTVYQARNAERDFHEAFGAPAHRAKDVRFLSDGERREIASLPFSFLDCTSHSHSDLAVLDETHRILFCGDIIDPHQVLLIAFSDDEGTYIDRVRLHLEAMKKVLLWEDHFDRICPSHNETPIPKEYPRRLIRLDEALLQGTAVPAPLDHKYLSADADAPYLRRVRGEGCSIIYRLPRNNKEII